MCLLWQSGKTEVSRAEGAGGRSAVTVLGSVKDEGVPGSVAIWGGCRASHPYKSLKSVKKDVSVVPKTSPHFLHCLVNSEESSQR